MKSVARWIPFVLFAALAGIFAYLNAGVSVPLSLGFATLSAVPLSVIVFAAFLLGMVVMFVVGLRQDLRIRRALQQSGFAESAGPGVAEREASSRRGDPSDPLW